MKLNDIYESTSNFLKAADLQGKKPVLTIATAEVVEKDYQDGNGPKKQIVLSFEQTEKVLGLNFTNASRIAELTGSEDCDDWVGVSIKLFTEIVAFQNKKVDAIRIFPELPEAPAKGKVKAATQEFSGNQDADDDSGDISIPF